ncbi:transposase [Streptomyces sp. NRRL F-5727]|uniref:transposase n=1 Tax=Streptomyces sp. NRRL F-5727 TaxID=1463871 RepID=UPI002D219782|nr:transposase [Streptomyces sp. NRRL F-5727]
MGNILPQPKIGRTEPTVGRVSKVDLGLCMIAVHGAGDLTAEQWATLELLLPRGAKPGRPPVWSRRQLIDGIRFRVRTGVP